MGFKPFSVQLKNTKLIAQTEAYRLTYLTVSPEHVLLALASHKDQVGLLLHQQGVDPEVVRKLLPVGSGSNDRAIVDIEFSDTARVLMNMAANIGDSDDLKELANAHVLQALLLEHAVCSVVELLKSLDVDIETLRRRTDIILKLSIRPELGAEVIEESKSESGNVLNSERAVVATSASKLAVTDVFNDASISIIETARNAARAHNYPLVRLDHLLMAFVKLGLWRDYVYEMISFVRDEHSLRVNLIAADCNNDIPIDFADEVKDVLMTARELANTGSGLIEPLMLLYGMAWRGSPGLFKPDENVRLTQFTQKLRREIFGLNERKDKSIIQEATLNPPSLAASEQSGQEPVILMLTERLVRVLRFAKFEAITSQSPLVEAPHLVLAIIRESFLSEIAFVKRREFDVQQLQTAVCRDRGIFTRPVNTVGLPSAIRLAPRSRGLLLLARDQARELRVPYVDLNHLVIALLEAEDWLRPLIANSEFSNANALVKLLKQCSLQQHHKLHGTSATADFPEFIHVNLDEVDELEPSSPLCLPIAAKDSIEERLSHRSEVVIGYAVEASRKLKHSQISIETIMLGLLYETFGTTFEVFSALGLSLLDAHDVIASVCCERISERTAALRPLSRNASKLLERAWSFAQLMKSDNIAPEHILLAVAEESKGVASFVCEALMLDGLRLRAELITAMSTSKKDSDPCPADKSFKV